MLDNGCRGCCICGEIVQDVLCLLLITSSFLGDEGGDLGGDARGRGSSGIFKGGIDETHGDIRMGDYKVVVWVAVRSNVFMKEWE